MDISSLAFFTAVFFGYLMNAITGFAGNVFIMPVGFQTIGIQQSIAALNVTGLCSCGLVAILAFKHIVWKELAKMTAVMFVFMLGGMWINTVVSIDILQIVFALFVLGVGLKNLLSKPDDGKVVPEFLLWGVLIVAGLIQGMFVSGGAMAIVYAVNKIKDKDALRGTMSMMWVFLNSAYTILLAVNGTFTAEIIGITLASIPILVVATFIGNLIVKRIKQESFLKLTYVLLVVIGVFMIVF